MANCVVCNTSNVKRETGDGDFARFECDRCGAFALSGTAEAALPAKFDEMPLRRSLMSHTLRRMRRPDRGRLHIISTDELPSFWPNDQLPTPQQQHDALILWIGANQPSSFENAEIPAKALAAFLGLHISPRGDGGGLGWLLPQLVEKGLFRHSGSGSGKIGFRLTLDGWERYEA